MNGPSAATLPIPPATLLQRIGPMGEADPVGEYERSGRYHRQLLLDLLPNDWNWSGKRVLDFGCGVGRILRQFQAEAGEAEFWGCELDPPSVEWMKGNFEPPFHIFETTDTPGLRQEDGSFDLIYAFSVYTHLTDHWAGWMLEHHRVLKDGGLLFVTFLGQGMTKELIGEEWDEDRIGMNTLMHDNPWDHGGPIAFNSEWWIRAHWGRAFDVVDLRSRLEPGSGPSHGGALLRKKSVQLSEEDLTRTEPDEPREILALQHQSEQQRAETRQVRQLLEAEHARLAQHEAELANAREEITAITSSLSWRLTTLLRGAEERLRPRR